MGIAELWRIIPMIYMNDSVVLEKRSRERAILSFLLLFDVNCTRRTIPKPCDHEREIETLTSWKWKRSLGVNWH